MQMKKTSLNFLDYNSRIKIIYTVMVMSYDYIEEVKLKENE